MVLKASRKLIENFILIELLVKEVIKIKPQLNDTEALNLVIYILNIEE